MSKESAYILNNLSNNDVKILDNMINSEYFMSILNSLHSLITDSPIDQSLAKSYTSTEDFSEFQYRTIINRHSDYRDRSKYNASLHFGNMIKELDDIFFEECYGISFDDLRFEFMEKYYPEELQNPCIK